MKLFLIIFFTSFSTIGLFSQDCNEYEKHLSSVDSTYYPVHIESLPDTVVNANRAFIDYVIENRLEKPSYKCFITNRNLLRKLEVISCDSSKVVITDTLKNGESCKIELTTGVFDPNKHDIVMNEDSSTIEAIDGHYPYGGQYDVPHLEIKDLDIEISGRKLSIPGSVYSNLYEPNICNNHGFYRRVEAYESLNGEYLYVYIYGGNAASTYFTKLVFNKSKYITRIVSDYYPLSIYASFRENFIGF